MNWSKFPKIKVVVLDTIDQDKPEITRNFVLFEGLDNYW